MRIAPLCRAAPDIVVQGIEASCRHVTIIAQVKSSTEEGMRVAALSYPKTNVMQQRTPTEGSYVRITLEVRFGVEQTALANNPECSS